GTVREDYSSNGDAWGYFPFELAASKTYRWGEDGLAGICDRYQVLVFALALWNERDPILKERLFGLVPNQGNHGEDVKECYFYLDNTPSHSYMKWLYKYPQREFPYADLVDENLRRAGKGPEYELLDTGIFDDDRYFDVFVEYGKASPEDIVVKVTAWNRGPEPAPLRQGRLPSSRHPRRGRRESRRCGDEGLRPAAVRGPPRGLREPAHAAHSRPPGGAFRGRGQGPGPAQGGGRRVLQSHSARGRERGREAGAAAGLRQPSLDQADLHLRREPLAGGRQPEVAAPALAPGDPQLPLAPPQLDAHPVHAGQMG